MRAPGNELRIVSRLVDSIHAGPLILRVNPAMQGRGVDLKLLGNCVHSPLAIPKGLDRRGLGFLVYGAAIGHLRDFLSLRFSILSVRATPRFEAFSASRLAAR